MWNLSRLPSAPGGYANTCRRVVVDVFVLIAALCVSVVIADVYVHMHARIRKQDANASFQIARTFIKASLRAMYASGSAHIWRRTPQQLHASDLNIACAAWRTRRHLASSSIESVGSRGCYGTVCLRRS